MHCQHPFYKAALCVCRGGRLLITINLLLAGQGWWGPGMYQSLGLPVLAGMGPSALSHPCLRLWFPARSSLLLAVEPQKPLICLIPAPC